MVPIQYIYGLVLTKECPLEKCLKLVKGKITAHF